MPIIALVGLLAILLAGPAITDLLGGTIDMMLFSKSNARDPTLPLISKRIAFFRPSAKRDASKAAIAPESSRPKKTAASSTVTGP